MMYHEALDCAYARRRMMTKRIGVAEARANLSDILGAVYYTHEPVIVEKKGRPMAVLISSEQYDQYNAYRRTVMERFGQARDEIQARNANKDPDEIYRDVTAIVEEVRREQHEREHSR
jgi:prevent-host-death family protein